MKKIEIFNDENSIVIDDKYDVTTFEFFPEAKKFTINSSIKNDCFFHYSTYEYKISAVPIKLQTRLLERSDEPPLQHAVKDGVVLESEILSKEIEAGMGAYLKSAKDNISSLKIEVEWNKVEILGNYEVNLYILSKHPEIISKEDYRKFLRQSIEKIKSSVLEVEEAVKQDTHGLEISISEYGKSIWYPNTESERKELDKYYDLPEGERKRTNYERKLKYIEKFKKSLFAEESSKYVGIPEYEFRSSDELVKYIEKVLDNKHIVPVKKNKNIAKNKWIIVIILSIIALSWGIWIAIGAFMLGAIIIRVISE